MKLNRLSNVFDFLFFLLKKILKYDNISMKVLESKQVSHMKNKIIIVLSILLVVILIFVLCSNNNKKLLKPMAFII